MKSFGILVLISVLSVIGWSAPGDVWQTGRIVDVQKNVNTKTLYWLVNTPVTQDETTYIISVHLKDKILMGRYELGHGQEAPPETWVKDRAVRVEIAGDMMYLRAPAGTEYKLSIMKRKAAAMMRPVSAAELVEAESVPESKPEEAVTGFIPPTKETPAKPMVAAPVTPAVDPTGIISVRSTPYLADVFVDEQNMGYTPAKVSLAPGKHTVRLEKQGYKSWSKEITLTAGSELLLDASLEKK